MIGLSEEIACEQRLRDDRLLGQFGTLKKVIVNKDKPFTRNNIHGPSYSAYVTFASEEEASIAILAIDGFEYNRRILKASYGMTKYCSFFIKNLTCPNDDCLYLHKLAAEKDSFNKEEGNPARYVQKVRHRDIIEYVIANNKDFWKLGIAKANKLGGGFSFPGPQTSWNKIKTYCRERGIPYDEPKESPKKKLAVAQVKKPAKLLTTSKWSNEEELPIFPLRNVFEMEENVLNPIPLEKSTSVRVNVRDREKTKELTRSDVDNVQQDQIEMKKTKQTSFTPKYKEKRECFSPQLKRNNTSIESKGKEMRVSPEKPSKKLAQEQTRDTQSYIPNTEEEEITSEMEEVLERQSDEYSELDRQIMKGLNKSYFKLKKEESRFLEDKSLSDSSKEMRTKCTDIKNIIDNFLKPNTELLTKQKPQQKAIQNDGSFRLFGQSYTLNKPCKP